jgi:serine/threonine-protein phosphatase 2A activator
MAHGAVNEKLPQLRILDENQTHTFIIPVKKINEGHDVSAFLTSKAYSDIMTFVLQLNYAMFPNFIPCPKEGQDNIKTWELDDSGNAFSDTVNRLRNLLVDIEAIIDKTPPDPGPRRFGNISFRKWAESVESQSKALLERHLPLQLLRVRSSSDIVAHDELASYLLGSFGSSQRLDYGTGHELSFLAFLGSIWKLGGFEHSKIPGDEERGIVLGVIAPYVVLKTIGWAV